MFSFHSIITLVTLPLCMFIVFIKYLLFGGRFRKYQSNLTETLTIEALNRFFLMGVPEYTSIMRYGPERLLNSVVPLLTIVPTKTLPSYGTPYDNKSYWLVKNNLNKDDPVIIYLHGGGYFAQAVPAQIAGVMAVYNLLDKPIKQKTSVLFSAYTLASKNSPVPQQTHELNETYEKLLLEGHTNIVLMGDSAGGHLALSFLQLLKNNSSVIFPRNVVLISPWINLQATKEQFQVKNSHYDNRNLDYLTYQFLSSDKTIKNIVGNSSHENLLVNPGRQPLNESDWVDIPTLFDENYSTFVIMGEDEVFRDDILKFCNKVLDCPIVHNEESGGKFDTEKAFYFRKDLSGKANLQVVIEPWGVHDASMILEHNSWSKLDNDTELKWVNPETHFGTLKITEYLNETL